MLKSRPLEYVGPAFVLDSSDASFLQHVITHSAEHFKLLDTGEVAAFSSLTDDFEQVAFEHGPLR